MTYRSRHRYRSHGPSKPLPFRARICCGLLSGVAIAVIVMAAPVLRDYGARAKLMKASVVPASKTWAASLGSFRALSLQVYAGSSSISPMPSTAAAEPLPYDSGWDIEEAAKGPIARFRYETTTSGSAAGLWGSTAPSYDPNSVLMAPSALTLATSRTNTTLLTASVPLVIPRSFAAPAVGSCPSDSSFNTNTGLCTRWLKLKQVCIVVTPTSGAVYSARPGCALLSLDAIASPVVVNPALPWEVKGTGIFGYTSLPTPPSAPLDFSDVVVTVRSKDDMYVVQESLTAAGDPPRPTMSYGYLPTKPEVYGYIVGLVASIMITGMSITSGGLFTILWLVFAGLKAAVTCRCVTFAREHGGRFARMWKGHATLADAQHPSMRGLRASARQLGASLRRLNVDGSAAASSSASGGGSNNPGLGYYNASSGASSRFAQSNILVGNNKAVTTALAELGASLDAEPSFAPPGTPMSAPRPLSVPASRPMSLSAPLTAAVSTPAGDVHVTDLALIRPTHRKSLGLAASPVPKQAAVAAPAPAPSPASLKLQGAAMAALLAQRAAAGPVIKVARTNNAGIVAANETWKARLEVAPSSHSLAAPPGVIGTSPAEMVAVADGGEGDGRAGALLSGGSGAPGGPAFDALIASFDTVSNEEALLDLLMRLRLLVGSLPEADRAAHGGDMKRAITTAASAVKRRHDLAWSRPVAAAFLEVVKLL